MNEEISQSRIHALSWCSNSMFRQFSIIFASLTLIQTAFSADPETFRAHWLEVEPHRESPDYVQFEAAGAGWFQNLGPTGIRAMLTDEQGKTEWQGEGIQYDVKYIFPNSPASGKVHVGDIRLETAVW